MSENYSTPKSTEDQLTDIICSIPITAWKRDELYAHIHNPSNYEFSTIYNNNKIHMYFGALGDACIIRIGELMFSNSRLTSYRKKLRKLSQMKEEEQMKQVLSELTKK